METNRLPPLSPILRSPFFSPNQPALFFANPWSTQLNYLLTSHPVIPKNLSHSTSIGKGKKSIHFGSLVKKFHLFTPATHDISMQATIANGSRTRAPHELAVNQTASNNTVATPAVGYSSVGSASRRVRSRDNQTSLSEYSSYGLMESGSSRTLTRDANQQLYADLNCAAYTYGQPSAPRSLNWPLDQSTFSDGINGHGYGYDRGSRSVNWSKSEQSYSDYVNPTYGHEQARNYMYSQDLSYPKYQQEPVQQRNNSVSTHGGPALSSGETSAHRYGTGYQHRSWTSAGNVFASRESSVIPAGLYSQDSAYYSERDANKEKSLSPPSSQLFLPESSDFFLDYTDVGPASDVSSIHGPPSKEEAETGSENIGQISVPDCGELGNEFSESTTGAPTVSGKPSSTTRETKRLKIETNVYCPETTSSPTAAEPSSAVSSNSPRSGKKFPCSFCAKVFNRPSSRNTHELVHTGEKPHMCTFPTCLKRFSVLSNLRRHLKIHRSPPKCRGRHANNNNNSNSNSNNNNNNNNNNSSTKCNDNNGITNSHIISTNSGNNINSINSNMGSYIQGPTTTRPHAYEPSATSPHPYGRLGGRDYFF